MHEIQELKRIVNTKFYYQILIFALIFFNNLKTLIIIFF